MTADNDNTPSPDIESALTELHEHNDQAGFLQSLAAGEVVLPQMELTQPEEGVKLPFIEQEGTRYVLAFSSEQRLTESGIGAASSIAMRGAELGAAWPQGEELWLAINPGSEEGATLPPDAVRALPTLAASG